MTPEDLLADLPPIRDDEPSSLRQDIADELADHLQCAAHRELVKSGGPDEVEQRVLDRFGDPRAVARKLWWLAMWSRIMSQRVLLGFSLAGNVAAVLISAAVFWQFAREREGLVQGQHALAGQLAEQRAELTAQLASLRNHLATIQTDLERQPAAPLPEPTLKIRLLGQAEFAGLLGTSAFQIKGLELRNQALEKTVSVGSLPREIDLGTVVAGHYRIAVRIGEYEYEQQLTLEDGDVVDLPIECPQLGPLARPRLAFTLPEDLADRGVVFVAQYLLRPVEIAGRLWQRPQPMPFLRSRFSNGPFPDGRGRPRFYLTLLGADVPDSAQEQTLINSTSRGRPSRLVKPGNELDWGKDPSNEESYLLTLYGLIQKQNTFLSRTMEPVTSGAQIMLSRLVFVDGMKVQDTSESGGRWRSIESGRSSYGSQFDHAVLVFDSEKLAAFPRLSAPIVLGEGPISVEFPAELLQTVRQTFEHASAANATVPANSPATQGNGICPPGLEHVPASYFEYQRFRN